MLMNVRRQSDGEVLSLDDTRPIGRGGEGNIYAVRQSNDLAVKIYHSDKSGDDDRIRKLETMLANVPADRMQERRHVSIAWPTDLVLSDDQAQSVIGFLMPRIQKAQPIHVVCEADTRKVFPSFTYRSLCRTARNLASAVWAIHEAGYVIGDIKDANILVTADALVTLVDTDSFQVTEGTGRIYRCKVATLSFTAPEMLGADPETANRTKEQDLFGLAILFFQLMMEGTWPFSSVLVGVDEAPDLRERLRNNYFPYDGRPDVIPPPHAPPFELLHPSLRTLFQQCFGAGHADPRSRPDARTWYRTFRECEESFVRCRINPQHDYFSHYSHCPWCERARALNWDPFPASKTTGTSYAPSGSPGAARPMPSSGYSSKRQRPAPGPAAPTPAPSHFSASTASVSLGQPVTLQWAVPNAQSVQITDQSGRSVFQGNSANGSVTVYPTNNKTYQLVASGYGVRLPQPITVAVTEVQPPMKLAAVSVELNEPIWLHSVRCHLQRFTPLSEVSVRPGSLLNLKWFLPLGSHGKLNRISVPLKTHVL